MRNRSQGLDGGSSLCSRVPQRFDALFQVLAAMDEGDRQRAGELTFLNAVEDFYKAMAYQIRHSQLLHRLATSLRVVYEVYQAHFRIGAIYEQLGVVEELDLSNDWRRNWNADRKEQESWFNDAIDDISQGKHRGQIGNPFELDEVLSIMATQRQVRALRAPGAAPAVDLTASPEILDLITGVYHFVVSRGLRETSQAGISWNDMVLAMRGGMNRRSLPEAFNATAIEASLTKMGQKCRSLQGSEQISCRVHRRLRELFLLLSGLAPEQRRLVEFGFLNKIEDFSAALSEQQHSSPVIQCLATSRRFMSRVLQVQGHITEMYARLGRSENLNWRASGASTGRLTASNTSVGTWRELSCRPMRCSWARSATPSGLWTFSR